MKYVFCVLFLIGLLFPLAGQAQYISCVRDEGADRIENLNGDKGYLLLAKRNDLVVVVTNARKYEVYPSPERPDGYYEYRIIVDADETFQPKVEVSKRGSVYKTDFLETVKSDFLIAFRLEEVMIPIRMDAQESVQNVHFNETEAALEFTSSIKGLQVHCHPDLKAVITSKKHDKDVNITIITVTFPLDVIRRAKERVEEANKAFVAQDVKINEAKEQLPDAEWDTLDVLDLRRAQRELELQELTAVDVFAEGTNHLPISVADLGPRDKKCYVVLPLVIEKNIFVTECSQFMDLGTQLFNNRKYKEARDAYESAFKAEDVVPNMRMAIRESIGQCDSCMLYDDLAARTYKKILELKKEGTATQEEVSNYASALIDFFSKINNYNPCDYYRRQIDNLQKQLNRLPLKIKFRVVEWKTLNEGDYIPGVEFWAYHGDTPISSNMFSTDKKFQKVLEKNGTSFQQIGVTDENGIVELELDREKLPKGFLFRPDKEKNIKIKYMTMEELMRQARGTFMEKQFRLKMFVK